MKAQVEFALKIIATAIAVFGVWKYFDDRASSAQAARQAQSLGYIERFGADDLLAARTRLLQYWKDYPDFAAFAANNVMSPRAYANFINATYPNRPDRADVDRALFRIQVFFDEVAYCRASGVCDAPILDAFFCNYVTRYGVVYGPFFARLSSDIGAAPIDRNLQALATICTAPKDGA